MPTDMHQLPREEFIERNLGLVHACAGRFKGRGIEYEELYAAGCLGLVKACDGFDTGRGVCFSTYAVPVILGEIKKLFRDGGTVKVSRSLKELSLKINAERERCLKRTGQEPGVTELAETLGTTPEQIALAIRAALPTLSLTPVDDEDGLREVLAVHNGRGGMDYIVVSGCNDAARLQSIQHRIQRQMEGMDNSVEKVKHRVRALERLKGKLYWR